MNERQTELLFQALDMAAENGSQEEYEELMTVRNELVEAEQSIGSNEDKRLVIISGATLYQLLYREMYHRIDEQRSINDIIVSYNEDDIHVPLVFIEECYDLCDDLYDSKANIDERDTKAKFELLAKIDQALWDKRKILMEYIDDLLDEEDEPGIDGATAADKAAFNIGEIIKELKNL